MTFALALATEKFGLMAADCRTRWREYDATQDTIVPLSTANIENSNKLRQLPAGWLVGGPHATWKDRLYEHVRDLPASDVIGIRRAARVVAAEMMTALKQDHWTTLADDVRQRLVYFVIGPNDDGFTCTAMNWMGEDLWPGGLGSGRSCVLGPDEWPPDEMNRELIAFERRLRTNGSEGPRFHVIRETAALFRRVCSRADPNTGSVNQLVTIGTLRRESSRVVQEIVGPIESWSIMGLPDVELAPFVMRVAETEQSQRQ